MNFYMSIILNLTNYNKSGLVMTEKCDIISNVS